MKFDSTRCIGCHACQAACKRWWELKAEKTSLNPTKGNEWTNPLDLTPRTWLLVKFVGIGEGDDFGWHFVQERCMHCLNPSCRNVCPVGAITKYEEGPVIIDVNVCIGCKYCVAACPFNIPRYDEKTNKVYKCTMCPDRIQKGLKPACVATCPTNALEFGERDTMLAQAQAKAQAINGYVYGDEENEGTSVFIVTTIPPEQLGYYKVDKTQPISLETKNLVEIAGGVTTIGVLGLLAVISIVANRRNKISKGKVKEVLTE